MTLERRALLQLMVATMLVPSASLAAPASDPIPRPNHLPAGSSLGEKYTIEGLVAVHEGRMVYLAKNAKSERFIVSARWDSTRFEGWRQLVQRGVTHPALAPTVDLLVLDEVMYSLTPYTLQGSLTDEAAPLTDAQVLDLAEQVLGLSGHLAGLGIALERVKQGDVLLKQDLSVQLFDLDVRSKDSAEALAPAEKAAMLPSLGALIASYCHVDAKQLARVAAHAGSEAIPDPATLARELAATRKKEGRRVTSGAMSSMGVTRQVRADSWAWSRITSGARAYAVADGLGAAPGALASSLAVSSLHEALQGSPIPVEKKEVEDFVLAGVRAANQKVLLRAQNDRAEMGTSLVCALVVDDATAYVAQVGDTRLYLLRDGTLHQVTKDHSLVAKMVEAGKLPPDQARTHEHRNILLRSLGTEPKVEADLFRVNLEAGDRLLLCSAGLWAHVDDAKLASLLLQHDDPRMAARELTRAALTAGEDRTAVVVQVG